MREVEVGGMGCRAFCLCPSVGYVDHRDWKLISVRLPCFRHSATISSVRSSPFAMDK